MNTLIKVGLVALGGYFVATRTNLLCAVGIGASCTPAAPLPSTGGPQPGTTPGVTPAPVAAAPPVAYNTIAAIYGRLVAALQQNGVAQSQGQYVATPWQFAYWLKQISGIDITPSIGTIFAGCGTGGACDTGNITLPQFWSPVATWLQQTQGLSGLGLARLAAALRGLGCNAYGGPGGRYSCFPAKVSYANGTAWMTSGVDGQ